MANSLKLAMILCAAGCSSVGTVTWKLASTKIIGTRYRVEDTPGNQVAVKTCAGSIAKSYGLEPSQGSTNSLFGYGFGDGGLLGWKENAHETLLRSDIVNPGSFVNRLVLPQPGDEVSIYLQDRLPPALMSSLSNNIGAIDQPLLDSLATEFDHLIFTNSILYEPQMFRKITHSPRTLDLLTQKSSSLARLNRALLDDAYPGEIRPMGVDQLVLQISVASGRKSRLYKTMEAQLTRSMKAVFDERVSVTPFAYWIP